MASLDGTAGPAASVRPSASSTCKDGKPRSGRTACKRFRRRVNGEKLLYRQGDKWFNLVRRRSARQARRGAEARRAGSPGRSAGRVEADVPRSLAASSATSSTIRTSTAWISRRPRRSTRRISMAWPAGPTSTTSSTRCSANSVLGHMYVGGGDDAGNAEGEGRSARRRLHDRERPVPSSPRSISGENWNPQLRAPLTQPGVNVKQGEYLLAVNGRDLKATDDIYQAVRRRRPASRSA